ncbi:hypothetical protein FQR65_LT20946 [Abscondita terminalis]|nr:hypothetical protein FQR65_LT20946 [Abscondita terminalis]
MSIGPPYAPVSDVAGPAPPARRSAVGATLGFLPRGNWYGSSFVHGAAGAVGGTLGRRGGIGLHAIYRPQSGGALEPSNVAVEIENLGDVRRRLMMTKSKPTTLGRLRPHHLHGFLTAMLDAPRLASDTPEQRIRVQPAVSRQNRAHGIGVRVKKPSHLSFLEQAEDLERAPERHIPIDPGAVYDLLGKSVSGYRRAWVKREKHDELVRGLDTSTSALKPIKWGLDSMTLCWLSYTFSQC